MAAIVLNWKQWGLTVSCVGQLLNMPDRPTHVLVVDNESAQAPPSLPEEASLLRLDRNHGFAGGMNRGMVEARRRWPETHYVWILNNDVSPRNGALAELIRVAESKRAAAVSPLIMRGARVWHSGRRRSAFTIHGRLLDPPPDRSPYRADYLSAASLLLDLRAVAEVGYFDEHYFFYFEDADLCERLSSRGLPLLVAPAALVLHEGSLSSGGVGPSQHPALDYYFASAALHFVRTRARRNQWSMMLAYAGIIGRRLVRPWVRGERWKLTKLAALSIGIVHGWRGRALPWNDVASRLPGWLAPRSSWK